VGEELKAHSLKTASRRAGKIAVTADDGLETFLWHESERLLERDEHGDRGRRRRLRLLKGSFVRGEVEIRLRKIRFLVRLPRAWAHRDHGNARRGAPGFLRRGDADVDAPLVDLELGAAGAGNTVEEEELSGIAYDRRDVLDRIQDPGRGLVVRDQHGLRGVLALLLRELIANEVGLDRSAVGNVDAPRVHAVGLADRGEPLAERAPALHEHLAARRDR